MNIMLPAMQLLSVCFR